MKKILKNGIIILYYIIQLTILSISLLACTSTIEMLPWYEPLTMGAFFVLLYIFPIQVIISIILSFSNSGIIPKTFNIISNTTTSIIALNLFTLSINSSILAIIISIIEIVLIIMFVIIVIKQFIKFINQLRTN